MILSHLGTTMYRHQLPSRLRDSMKLVFVDLAGTGLSTGGLETLSLSTAAHDVDAVCQALGLEHVHMLGHSVLGVLAAEIAWRCPQRVSTAILVCSPPITNWQMLRAHADQYFALAASPQRKARYRDGVSTLTLDSSWRERLEAETPRRYFDFLAPPSAPSTEPVHFDAVTRVLSLPDHDWDIVERAQHRRTPLFVATGRHDFVVPCPLWEVRLPFLPQAWNYCFERSGHQPFVEEPDTFTDALLDWVARNVEKESPD